MAEPMLIDVEGGWIQISRALGKEADADLRLEVTARVDGFQGFVDTWVPTEAWNDFSEALAQLEAARQGEAILESLTPGELALAIRSVDPAGHVAVSGRLSRDDGTTVLSMSFGPCALDPSLLPQLVRASRRLAG
ncbi:MAG: hypothetical protein CMN30_22120 [Sandaracinus sp.]|nr:hypothetical protein [Sandaracinus sp.]